MTLTCFASREKTTVKTAEAAQSVIRVDSIGAKTCRVRSERADLRLCKQFDVCFPEHAYRILQLVHTHDDQGLIP